MTQNEQHIAIITICSCLLTFFYGENWYEDAGDKIANLPNEARKHLSYIFETTLLEEGTVLSGLGRKEYSTLMVKYLAEILQQSMSATPEEGVSGDTL